MKFTMPDKESVPTEYMLSEDVDFLKRKSYFNPDIGYEVGVLAESSIIKRLSAHLRSSELSLETQSAMNMESSLHDWTYYGREVFEDRQAKLLAIPEKHGISHLCPALKIGYDERILKWKEKYLMESTPSKEIDDDDLPVFQEQCGCMEDDEALCQDHCIGTALNPFFWWEHAAADLGVFLHIPFHLLLAFGLIRVKYGMINKMWLFLLTFLCNFVALMRVFVLTFLALNTARLIVQLYIDPDDLKRARTAIRCECRILWINMTRQLSNKLPSSGDWKLW
jgi:hypothetical protein